MKNVLIFSISIILSASCFSQNPNGWIEEGAEFYHVINDGAEQGYARYYLTEEVEVNGKMLQRLNIEEKTRTTIGPNQYLENDLVELPWSRLFHTSNDSVYFANEQGELSFAWHLNPQVGDVWDFGQYALFSEEGTMNAFAIVTDVQDVIINGVPSKDITISSCIDLQGTPFPFFEDQTESHLWVFHQGKINTVFGPHSNFHYLGFYEISPNVIYCPSGFSSLACYRSSSVDLIHFLPSQSCTGGVASIENETNAQFQIYPNPASTSFTLTHPEQIKSIQIFDVQGRLQSSHTSVPIHIENLNAGVYWVHVESLDGTMRVEKLMTE